MIEEGPNLDLRHTNLSPIKFLFMFRGLFGVKTSFSQTRKFNFTLWERREDGKQERSRILHERKGNASGIRGDNPYQGM